MTRLILQGGEILTLDEEDHLFNNSHSIIIDKSSGIIESITKDYTPRPDDEILDCTDQVVMPGLVDMHFHSAVARGWNDHMPLKEYLEECWYPSIRALDEESAYWVGLASYTEAIKSGTTHVNDMYRFLGGLARAAGDIGIRATLSNDIALDECKLDTLEDARAAHEKWHGSANGRVKVRVGIEWLPLANKQLLLDARKLADELKTGIHLHLNESPVEVEIVKGYCGKGPTELAYECGILGPDCSAAHCVHLSDNEIELMQRTGTFISHNPSSNAKLGNGIARLDEWLKREIIVGIGHDAAECNNSRDLFEVMKFCSLIHRAKFQDPTLLQAKEVLKMCCINGNLGLNYDKYAEPIKAGVLKPGYKADIITLDINNIKMVPLSRSDSMQYYSNIVFSCNGSVVKSSVIDGQVVMKDRKLVNVNEEEIVRKANEIFLKIKDDIHA